MASYVKWIRERVGHDPIFLNAAGGFVLNKRGEILLLRRGQGEQEGSWTVPGGIMELGETPKEAAQREVFEETGLEVRVDDLVGVYTNPVPVKYPNGDQCQLIDIFFACTQVGGALKTDGDETLGLRYFHPDERPALFRPHVEKALQDFLTGIKGLSM